MITSSYYSCINIKEIPDHLYNDKTIKKLFIYCNDISRIENLPPNLEILDIENNKIKKIENISHLNNLKSLWIGNNNISKIDNLPPNLEQLFINHNNIYKIENLPLNLTHLWIGNNCLSHLDNLSYIINLKILNIGNNKIKKIENLPPNLIKLYAHHNDIEKIENLPPQLEVLDINYNKINNPINSLEKYRRWEKYNWIYFRLHLLPDYGKFICYYLGDFWYKK